MYLLSNFFMAHESLKPASGDMHAQSSSSQAAFLQTQAAALHPEIFFRIESHLGRGKYEVAPAALRPRLCAQSCLFERRPSVLHD